MIVLRSPKGWTGPKVLAGKKLEGFWRAHQVPLPNPQHDSAQLKCWRTGSRATGPEELFDEQGTLRPELAALSPAARDAWVPIPMAMAVRLRRKLRLPPIEDYAVAVENPGQIEHENTAPLGALLRDIIGSNPDSMRVFGPDETASNRLQAIYEVSKKVWMEELLPEDDNGGELAREGRVVEMLSEHTLVGMMEGYLLTGRYGFFHTYEAFAHVIASMFNQHAKWLESCNLHAPGVLRSGPGTA
jgi:xylulose-5-phosphate/fructose-6-phosphate phosphoketolase